MNDDIHDTTDNGDDSDKVPTGEMIGFLNMPKVELEVSSGDQYLLCHADEMLSPIYEIATALMSYEWVSKSSVWDNNSPYFVQTRH